MHESQPEKQAIPSARANDALRERANWVFKGISDSPSSSAPSFKSVSVLGLCGPAERAKSSASRR